MTVDQSNSSLDVTVEEIRQFVERIEHLEAEKKDIGEQITEVYSELKGRGYDSKAIRKIIGMRKLDPAQRDEDAAIVDLYMNALGMA